MHQDVIALQDTVTAGLFGTAERIKEIAQALHHLQERKTNPDAISPLQKQLGDCPLPIPLSQCIP